jgi:hydrogenase expression/formation protein HypC
MATSACFSCIALRSTGPTGCLALNQRICGACTTVHACACHVLDAHGWKIARVKVRSPPAAGLTLFGYNLVVRALVEHQMPVRADTREGPDMCLGIPGQVVEVTRDESLGLVMGKARFGGIVKDVNLTYTPDVEIGDYVIVHVGFALSRVEEHEAQEVFRLLESLGETRDLEIPEEGA